MRSSSGSRGVSGDATDDLCGQGMATGGDPADVRRREAAALLWWPHAPSFDARWVAMPPNINLETYRAARKGFGAAGVLHVGNV